MIFLAKPQQLNLDGMSQQMFRVSCFEVDLWEPGTSLFAAQMNLHGRVKHQQSKTSDGVNWQEFGGEIYLPLGLPVSTRAWQSQPYIHQPGFFKPYGQPRNLIPTFFCAPELVCGTLAKKNPFHEGCLGFWEAKKIPL